MTTALGEPSVFVPFSGGMAGSKSESSSFSSSIAFPGRAGSGTDASAGRLTGLVDSKGNARKRSGTGPTFGKYADDAQIAAAILENTAATINLWKARPNMNVSLFCDYRQLGPKL